MLGGIIFSRKKEDKHENKKIETRESGKLNKKGLAKSYFSWLCVQMKTFKHSR